MSTRPLRVWRTFTRFVASIWALTISIGMSDYHARRVDELSTSQIEAHFRTDNGNSYAGHFSTPGLGAGKGGASFSEEYCGNLHGRQLYSEAALMM